MKRRTLLAGALFGVLALAGAGAVMAQQSGESDGTSFLDRVAAKLGIDRPKLDQAIKDVRTEQIDEAVASGDLSQEQADALKERLDDLPADPGFGHGWGRGDFGFRANGHAFGFGFKSGFGLGDAKARLAEFLGITEDQLEDELEADGATLATVAEAHGKSRDELKSFIQNEAGAKLDEAVADGKLTQEQADAIEQRLGENVDALIDGTRPAFAGHRFGGFPGLPGLGEAKEKLAEFLGITEEQLRDELAADDATLASVAGAHGKSRDELKSFIETEAKTALDEAVASGALTQDRADDILGGLTERLDDIVDSGCGGFAPSFKRGMPFGGGADDDGIDLREFAPASRS